MADYPLTWADIWVLQAIHASSNSSHSTKIEDIIACADMLNHAVLTFAEFNNAVYKLTKNGLLSIDDNNLILTNDAHALFKKYASQSYLKQNESIRKVFGADGWSKDYDPNILTASEIYISKGNFNNAVIKYQKGYGF